MNENRLPIPEECIGRPLAGVRVLVLDISDEPGPPTREGVLLDLGTAVVAVQAMTDTSELAVAVGDFDYFRSPDGPRAYSIFDVSAEEPFCRFVGKPLRNWWSMQNEMGYDDGLTVAFEAHAGLCFIAMNNEVSVLVVDGEQMS